MSSPEFFSRVSNLSNLSIILIRFAIFATAVCFPYCNVAVNSYTTEFLSSIEIPSALISRSIDGHQYAFDGINVETDEVTFHLFTNANKESAQLLRVEDPRSLSKSSFNPKWPIKVIVHGWTDSVETYWYSNYRESYFSAGNYNLIFVDWSSGAAKEYFTSAKLTRPVGEYLGKFLDFLQRITNVSLSKFHIMGHSLGAHVAGFAGSSLSGRVGRITGMDPARPAFESPFMTESKDRLDSTDAKFVDIIHTCGGTVGFVSPIGHVDFYPNGGSFTQPGCPPITSQFCSHARSHQFMAESVIRPQEFLALRCESWGEFISGYCDDRGETAFMGENVSQDIRGKFYLRTNPRQPFGMNNDQTIRR